MLHGCGSLLGFVEDVLLPAPRMTCPKGITVIPARHLSVPEASNTTDIVKYICSLTGFCFVFIDAKKLQQTTSWVVLVNAVLQIETNDSLAAERKG